MQNRLIILTLLLLAILVVNPVNAQYTGEDESYKKCFAGSSFFMLGNFFPGDNPHFVQFNIGYRLSGKDAISLELKTWRYHKSLGIPYGDAYTDPAEKFPGYIRERGFALAYQRFLWKGFYAGIHVMSAWQTFVDSEDNEIDDGFQIFNTYRLGYHFKLFGDRFFLQPNFAVTHRPYHTEMPASFRESDDKWGKFFVGEPGLHFGFNF